MKLYRPSWEPLFSNRRPLQPLIPHHPVSGKRLEEALKRGVHVVVRWPTIIHLIGERDLPGELIAVDTEVSPVRCSRNIRAGRLPGELIAVDTEVSPVRCSRNIRAGRLSGELIAVDVEVSPVRGSRNIRAGRLSGELIAVDAEVSPVSSR